MECVWWDADAYLIMISICFPSASHINPQTCLAKNIMDNRIDSTNKESSAKILGSGKYTPVLESKVRHLPRFILYYAWTLGWKWTPDFISAAVFQSQG